MIPAVFAAFLLCTTFASGQLLDPAQSAAFGYCTIGLQADGNVMASGRDFAFAGPSWELTKEVQAGSTYTLSIDCTISTGLADLKLSLAEHLATVNWNPNLVVASATAGSWVHLASSYKVDPTFSAARGDKLVVYVEGAPPGVNITCGHVPAAAPIVAALPKAAEAFGRLIGAAVDAQALAAGGADAAALATNFDFVTPENGMKWDITEPSQGEFSFKDGDALVSFAAAHNLTVKGHCLVWGQQLPSWVAGVGDLRKAMLDHIAGVVGHYKGKVIFWDVVNEAVADDAGGDMGLKSTLFSDRLGAGFIADAFRAAHAADPGAILIYNEYGAEDMGPKSQRVFNLVSSLVKQGVPIDGVGMQSHFEAAMPDISGISQNMQRLANLGLIVLMSELDVQMLKFSGNLQQQLEQQAEVYSAVVGVCAAQARCKGVTVWGLDDTHSWLLTQVSPNERPLLLDAAYQRKPSWVSTQAAFAQSKVQAVAVATRAGRKLLQDAGIGPLGMGQASPVTVTFFSSPPDMDCADGWGQCGYGSDATGNTDFCKTGLYPLHVASGNFEFLGGCGACGILHYNGKDRGYVVTDVTDHTDSLGQRDWPPAGSHIDMCCDQFDYFQSLDHGNGVDCGNGGIFTGVWQRVPCETMGFPDYPADMQIVVRTQVWNRYAKAVVVSRLHGVGEVQSVDYATRQGGF
jgi:GH35 family endo-1,4-beta-xylanase